MIIVYSNYFCNTKKLLNFVYHDPLLTVVYNFIMTDANVLATLLTACCCIYGKQAS